MKKKKKALCLLFLFVEEPRDCFLHIYDTTANNMSYLKCCYKKSAIKANNSALYTSHDYDISIDSDNRHN